ncbi:O-antigen ligase family protein [Pontibacter sp. JH31]|uniref:O-antigen ligase family protein n=1 Tax=Pontibacter aquaedesilientis TaxID=2766980 RepID=A0ABR7XHD9_9BACT|nr:O-antigen ligase family protein [Pontibacter aquaedesilientis]MBD1397714.1 O-antigen ligase family protein [Pontibacter aquaedesilientis]
MNLFFLTVELFTFVFAIYVLLYKKELAIVYVPVFIFSRVVATPIAPASAYYAMISLFIIYFIYNNPTFFKENIFSLLLIVLYSILLTRSTDLETIRPGLFSVIWLFLTIPLIHSIYKKFSRDEVLEELAFSAFIILALFILNVLVSSFYGYSPKLMYGISSGILFGNLYATDFNILAFALFIILLYVINQKKPIYFLAFIVSLAFIMLSFRRSVMGMSLLGIAVILFIFMFKKNIKNLVLFGGLTAVISFVVLLNTNFLDVFIERYEQRKLAERELSEETRFLEYDIIYQDLFVYNDYNPWFGYELLNSGGNYGKGILDERTLHSDLTSIVHSTGIIGLLLYLLMVFTSFKQAFRYARSGSDNLIILYCAAAFVVYTITGRYTSSESMMFLFMILALPLTQKDEPSSTILSQEEYPALAPNYFRKLALK